MKRVEPSFKGSVSLTGAAATRLGTGRPWPCAGAAGAAESSAAAANSEARMRLIPFSPCESGSARAPGLRERVGHEVDDEPVLAVHQQHVAPHVAELHLLR